jgi:glycolate oxidase
MYNKITPDIVEALRQIVGEGDVLVDAEAMEPYTHDEVVGLRADPEVVVRVTSADQIAAVFRLAQREGVPVTPRGAGWGCSIPPTRPASTRARSGGTSPRARVARGRSSTG